MNKKKLITTKAVFILVGVLIGLFVKFPVAVDGGNYWTSSIYQFGVGNIIGGTGAMLMGGLLGFLAFFLIWGCKK